MKPTKGSTVNLWGSWQLCALGSAFFAALTALFGKIGVSDINSNLATFIRTGIILFLIGSVVSFRREWQKPENLSGHTLLFLGLSAVATGLSWLCYYRALQLGTVSQVAPVDKLSVALAILLAFLFLGEQASFRVLLGGSLVVAGSLVLVIKQ
jgi:transporter family protein